MLEGKAGVESLGQMEISLLPNKHWPSDHALVWVILQANAGENSKHTSRGVLGHLSRVKDAILGGRHVSVQEGEKEKILVANLNGLEEYTNMFEFSSSLTEKTELSEFINKVSREECQATEIPFRDKMLQFYQEKRTNKEFDFPQIDLNRFFTIKLKNLVHQDQRSWGLATKTKINQATLTNVENALCFKSEVPSEVAEKWEGLKNSVRGIFCQNGQNGH